MCGIVGMAGDLNIKDRDLFEDLLTVCQLRGRDSTGVIRVSKEKEGYSWAKNLGTPEYLFESRTYNREIRQIGISALVGHCRHKTIGDVSISSAHPFDIEEKGIVGVHNGTLKNFYRFPEHKSGMVDSQVIYERIALHGAIETFSDLEGAYACVWWDQEAGNLNFIRNKERPLWYTYSKDCRKMFWASEPWMFGAIYRKENLWDGGKEGKVYRSFEEDVLYSIEISPNAYKGKPVFKVSESKKIEKKEQFSVGFQGNGTHCCFRTNTNGASTNTTSENKGGEVANPFLNDELPQHLTVPAKQPAKTTKFGTTQQNNNNSTTPSKLSLVQSVPSTSTESSSKFSISPPFNSSPPSQRTNRKKLSVVSDVKQNDGSKNNEPDTSNIYQANVGVDTRYIYVVDTEYITDLRTKVEVSEQEFKENTGGACCHCEVEITSLKEVAEIFDKGKRFICKTCVTPNSNYVYDVIKELA